MSSVPFYTCICIEGEDYDVEPHSLDFAASKFESLDTLCYNITLHQDPLLEPDEAVEFQLNSPDSFTVINPGSAIFTIMDSVGILRVLFNNCVILYLFLVKRFLYVSCI